MHVQRVDMRLCTGDVFGVAVSVSLLYCLRQLDRYNDPSHLAFWRRVLLDGSFRIVGEKNSGLARSEVRRPFRHAVKAKLAAVDAVVSAVE
jgi:hypothetical protein